MLREIVRVRQRPGEGHKRWFTDEYWDLFTWSDDDGKVTRIQVCYGKPRSEHALTWSKKGGYSHARIDDGQPWAGVSMSPLLVQDGVFDWDAVSSRFRRDAAGIEPAVAELVYETIRGYGTANG